MRNEPAGNTGRFSVAIVIRWYIAKVLPAPLSVKFSDSPVTVFCAVKVPDRIKLDERNSGLGAKSPLG